jgi:predicted DNA-binding transcriptional regulator AlpA
MKHANDNKRHFALPRSLPPIGLCREVAAAYIDVSPTKFDQMVADGRMPKPKRVDGRRIWDRIKIERYFAAIPGDEDGTEGNDKWAVFG